MRTALAALLLAAACGSGKPPTATPAPAPTSPETAPTTTPAPAEEPTAAATPSKPVTNKTLAAVGLDPDAMDREADPCEDFYQFSCGNWVAKNEVPADKPITMRSFIAIDDRNVEYEHDLLERAKTAKGDAVLEKLGTYYGSCMDEAAIEKQGLKPIKPMLDVINGVKDAKSLSRAVAVLHSQGFNSLFELGPTQDSADARNVIAGIDQGGLGLPDRDYYLVDNDQMKQIRAAYAEYVTKLLTIAGHGKTAAAETADIIALETQIAKISKDKVAMRDPKGTYNKIDRTGVAKAMPHFEWDTFWKTVGLKEVKDVTTSSPEFLSGLDALLVSTKPETWRNYLTMHLLSSAAPYLTKELDETRFHFRASLTGQSAQEPRWKRCARYTDGALGDLVGQAFVRDKFAGTSKQGAEDEVHAVVGAMSANLSALPWMDATTREKAAAKLQAMAYQIGYPKRWKSYAFSLDAKNFGQNALVADKAENARQLAKIGRPVDKDDWSMTTPTVNAYYNPQLNMMVFPAGILQPPFFSVDAALPVNLGAMGVVVGHELTHGFDDQGAQFDGDGNLRDWWQPETEKLFKQRTQCVKDQYSNYEIAGVKLNGGLTAGENIADIGGVKLALSAMHSLRASAPDTVLADGFTEDQQFFLAFGQAWCEKAKPEYEKLMATVNPHSPGRWRVNGALSATPDFAKAFHCKQGAKMLPAKQCVVW
jgi:predicted metalloendopeptidase